MAALCLLGPRHLASQDSDRDTTKTREVDIKSADLLEVGELDGQRIYRLDGNVVLTQENTTLRADRAVQYVDADSILFRGGVEIDDEGDTLRAEQIVYDTDLKLATGDGDVVWTDGSVTLTAHSGTYLVDEKIASFSGDVIMRDSAATITSTSGEYFVDEEVAYFVDGVRFRQDEVTILADSIRHDRSTSLTQASGAVRIYQSAPEDTDDVVVLIASMAESHREAGTNRIWGDPVMIRLEQSQEGSVDTLVVKAALLEITENDSLEWFRASGESRFWQGDLSGSSDSLEYVDEVVASGAEILMTGQPRLWSTDAQVSADSIRVLILDGKPQRLEAGPGAFVALEDTASNRIQQIKGTGLVATFRSDSLEQMDVRPQAEALYFGNSGDDEDESAVRFTASSIVLRFASGEVGKIVASNDVQGEIIEFEPQLPPSLDGFDWRPDARPGRNDMLTQRVLEALRSVPVEGKARTPDTGGSGTASD
jgi:lipopolysaccharide export system protein LptA